MDILKTVKIWPLSHMMNVITLDPKHKKQPEYKVRAYPDGPLYLINAMAKMIPITLIVWIANTIYPIT